MNSKDRKSDNKNAQNQEHNPCLYPSMDYRVRLPCRTLSAVWGRGGRRDRGSGLHLVLTPPMCIQERPLLAHLVSSLSDFVMSSSVSAGLLANTKYESLFTVTIPAI